MRMPSSLAQRGREIFLRSRMSSISQSVLKLKNIPRVREAFAQLQNKGLPVELQLQTGSRDKFLSDIASGYAVIIASLGDISPNTILEAVSYNKPFILTRETGLYEK